MKINQSKLKRVREVMDGKKRFKARIADKDYTIVGSLSATHLNTVVDLVNQQIDQLTELAPDLTNADRSILMAVNAVSDQLVKEKRIIELEAELAELQGKSAPVSQPSQDVSRPTINGQSTKGMIADHTVNPKATSPQINTKLTQDAQAESTEFPFKRK